MKPILTPEMEKYFIEYAYSKSMKSMAREWGVSDSVVKRAFIKNNIQVPEDIQKKFISQANRNPLTELENKYIINNILHKSTKQIAKDLKRSSITISKQCKLLGLDSILKKKIEESQYKKGNKPENKGKKWDEFMSAENQKKCLKTAFKKGNIPANKLEDFQEVTREDKRYGKTYILIRVPGESKLISKHVWLWEKQNNKKVPKGHMIVFKDNNSLNCTIENLECISNAEHMKRNSYLNNYPKDLQELIQVKGALTRQINKINNK